MATESTEYVPPTYTIDLSLPPKDRYREIALQYRDGVQDLTELFNALLADFAVPEGWLPLINRVARILLRRVYDPVQTQELKGISEAAEIPMYLLVAFNVILDSLMGCSSGGVRTLEKGQPPHAAKMLHFRTLDWAMDPLRRVIVQLNFVRSKSSEPRKVLATSITYVGFVGVLTGVREGLSMSLNFRAVHDANTKVQHFRFYMHHLLVLLGQRPSIATIMRSHLFEDDTGPARWHFQSRTRNDNGNHPAPDLATVYEKIRSMHTTAAYLIFSDGLSTMCLEKDFQTATMRSSDEFMAATNHDVDDHRTGKRIVPLQDKPAINVVRGATEFDDMFDESKDRLDCLVRRWERKTKRSPRGRTKRAVNSTNGSGSGVVAVTFEELRELVTRYPTTNESTHFAAILDPSQGKVLWARAYETPLDEHG